MEGRPPGIRVAAGRLVFWNPSGIVDRRLLQWILVRIVLRLLALRIVGGLARIAVAAGIEGIDGGVGIGVRHGITSGWEGVSKDRAGRRLLIDGSVIIA